MLAALQGVDSAVKWIEATRHGNQPELRGCAKRLLEDDASAWAELTRPESKGSTEGYINQLKGVKRAMDGRGKVDYLRQLVVW